jgi:hypothetical protein
VLLTHPRPEYRWPSVEKLIAQWRRSPVPPQQPQEKEAEDLAAQRLEDAWRRLLFSP